MLGRKPATPLNIRDEGHIASVDSHKETAALGAGEFVCFFHHF